MAYLCAPAQGAHSVLRPPGCHPAEPLLRLGAAHFSTHIDIHYKTPFLLDFLAYRALLSMLIRVHRIHLDDSGRIANLTLGASFMLSLVAVWLNAFHFSPAVDALSDLPFT